MQSAALRELVRIFALMAFLAIGVWAPAQTSGTKKVFMATGMEGVDGVFDEDLQCAPNKSPRWEESRKLLTEEINAAADGLFDGGATEVVVWDGHLEWGQPLSTGYPS